MGRVGEVADREAVGREAVDRETVERGRDGGERRRWRRAIQAWGVLGCERRAGREEEREGSSRGGERQGGGAQALLWALCLEPSTSKIFSHERPLWPTSCSMATRVAPSSRGLKVLKSGEMSVGYLWCVRREAEARQGSATTPWTGSGPTSPRQRTASGRGGRWRQVEADGGSRRRQVEATGGGAQHVEDEDEEGDECPRVEPRQLAKVA